MKFREQKKSLLSDNKSGSKTKKSLASASPKKKTAQIIRRVDRNEGDTKPQKQTKVRKSSTISETKEEPDQKYTWGYDDYEVEDSGFERYGRPPNKSLKRNVTREGSGLFESDINWKDIDPNEDD